MQMQVRNNFSGNHSKTNVSNKRSSFASSVLRKNSHTKNAAQVNLITYNMVFINMHKLHITDYTQIM